MTISASARMPSQIDTLVVPVFETDRGPRILPAAKHELPVTMTGVLASHAFTGAAGQVRTVHAGDDEPIGEIVYVGVGREADLGPSVVRRFGAIVGRSLYAEPRSVTILAPVTRKLGAAASVEATSEGLTTGRYAYDRWLSAARRPSTVDNRLKTQIVVLGRGASGLAGAVKRGAIVGDGINLCREIGDTPPNELGPEELASLARKAGKAAGCRVKVLTESALEREGMHAHLSVAKGSARPARLIEMSVEPSRASSKPPLVFVGKAITFDTGGISIKGREGMEAMKYDLGGGAAVVGALVAAARLKVRRRVIGLIAAAENMPGGAATRPGDIVRSASGTSIEIINTDAEGRLVLADALHYAKRFDPELVVDLATLTGASMVALRHYAGVFSPSAAHRNRVLKAAEAAGERAWPLPVDEDFVREMKSAHADLRNSAGRAGGASLAAAFLSVFAPDAWVHVDIAPVASQPSDTDVRPRGATGFGVRTLLELATST